jgi:hypothetical protein
MIVVISLVVLTIAAIVTRIVQVYKFLKLVSKLCRIYDRNYVDKHSDSNIQLIWDLMEKDYHLKSQWSAYQWVFFKGPNPWLMPFSLKPLTIDGQYGRETAEKFIEYYVFEDYEFKENLKNKK